LSKYFEPTSVLTAIKQLTTGNRFRDTTKSASEQKAFCSTSKSRNWPRIWL